MTTPDRLAVSIALLSLGTLVLGLLGYAQAFGVAAVASLILPLGFGWRKGGMARRMAVYLALFAIVLSALVLALFVFDRPDAAEPAIWLGYPRATAVFVYGVWPIGTLPAIIYGLYFRRAVLDEADLDAFLKRYSKHSATDRHGA